MGLQLRTGKNGKNVTSDSDGRLYAGIAGTDRYVLDDGNKLAASLSDSNTLVVQSGAMLINGRHVTLDGTQTWNIPNGAQGKKRSNLCVVRYTKDSNGTEIAEAVTLSGDLTDGDPVDPAYNNTSILQNGTTISDYPLYRVITDGISANDPVPLFNVLTPLATLGASVAQEVVDGWQILKIGSLAICRKAKQYTGLTPSRESGFANNSLSYGKVTITETLPYTLKDTATSVALAERDGFIAGSGNLDSGQKTNVRTNIFLANNTASSIWLNWIVYGTIV